MVTINSGFLKGRKLKFTYQTKPRPTTAVAKSAMFSILGDRIKSAHVLDCFAGSGAVGIEALSRGASSAAFIEKDALLAESLKKNIDQYNLAGIVHDQNFSSVFQYYRRQNKCFDFVFIDPPYFKGLELQATKALTKANVLHENSLLVIERHLKVEIFSKEVASQLSLKLKDSRRYGIACLDFFELD